MASRHPAFSPSHSNDTHVHGPSGSLPRPSGSYKSHPVNRPPAAERPRPDPDSRSPPERTPEFTSISLWPVIYIAVMLPLVVTLALNYDPFGGILDVESAKQHASLKNATLAFEIGKTEHERRVMEHERELWVKARESDAHVPHGAFWDVISPAPDCFAYGKREYYATLRNIPEGWDPTTACTYMPVEIKGVKIRHPNRCVQIVGFPHFEIQGHWTVDWDQPDCKPWFRDFEDKWCTGYNSGKRRIEAQIVGINSKGDQDWRLLCESTPLVWDMVTYPKPVRCEERLWGKKVAMWDIPDRSCLS